MMARSPVILFADSDLSWSRDARVELRRRGAEVRMARSAEEALPQVMHSAPDLVVLDAALEGRGSGDVVELFRQAAPDSEIILLESGMAAFPPGAGRGLFFSGAKPLAPSMLVSLAQSALGDRLHDLSENGVSRKPGTVLCVDDDPNYLRSVSRFLTRHGYRVETFDTAERALGALPRIKPDLALVDLMMPGMGGLDLARRIREETRGSTPVVFLTALDSDQAVHEAFDHGACYLLGKAEKPQKVLDVVDYLAGDLDEAERDLIKSGL